MVGELKVRPAGRTVAVNDVGEFVAVRVYEKEDPAATVAVSGLDMTGATPVVPGVNVTLALGVPPANQCVATSRIFVVAPPTNVSVTGPVPVKDTGTVQLAPEPVTIPTVAPALTMKSSALTPVTASLKTRAIFVGELRAPTGVAKLVTVGSVMSAGGALFTGYATVAAMPWPTNGLPAVSAIPVPLVLIAICSEPDEPE